MEKNDKNDFILDSKGRCFLCLDKTKGINTFVNQEHESLAQPFRKFSLYYLSRYLKMDLRKVFSDSAQIPPHLLAKVEKSRLKVELCEECVCLSKQFSENYRKLEKAEMELVSCLKRIHAKFMDNSWTGKPTKFKSLINVEPHLKLSSGGEMEILEVLREEAFQKSHHKLRAVGPRVKFRNLAINQIRAEKLKFSVASRPGKTPDQSSNILTPDSTAQPGGFSDSDFQASDSKIKLEPSDFLVDDDDDKHQPDDFNEPNEAAFEDFEDANPTIVLNKYTNNINISPESSMVVSSFHPNIDRKTNVKFGTRIPACNMNLETGKYNCGSCAMEFSTNQGYRNHYTSVHFKVRFKCVTCGKQFSQQSTCNRHQKSAHVGIRYGCQVCKKSFKRTDHVRQHQRTTECGKKLGLKSTQIKT